MVIVGQFVHINQKVTQSASCFISTFENGNSLDSIKNIQFLNNQILKYTPIGLFNVNNIKILKW